MNNLCKKVLRTLSSRPFYRYGGHIELIRVKGVLWDAQGGMSEMRTRVYSRNFNQPINVIIALKLHLGSIMTC